MKNTNVYFSSDTGKSLTGVSVFGYFSQHTPCQSKHQNVKS